MQFYSHFRMTRDTFAVILDMLQPIISAKYVSLERQLLSTLWILATPDSFRSVGEQFGLGKGSLHFFFLKICKALSSLSGDVIAWPSQDSLPAIARKFHDKAGIGGVVGCIDGTHIDIPGPSVNRASYVDRKGRTSVQLQAICDHDMKFLDVCVGYPGSVHDARVFRNSSVNEKLEALHQTYHILGDSAYPLKLHVMVPFRDNGHLTETQRLFNHRHSSTRVKIEHAFGHLKIKFRRLKMLDMALVADVPYVIMAACVLHNVILAKEDLPVMPDGDVANSENAVGVDGVGGVADAEAVAKRNVLANSL